MNEHDVELALQGGKVSRINQRIAIEQYSRNHKPMQNHKCIKF